MNEHSGLRKITQRLDTRDKSSGIPRREWRIIALQLNDALAIRHRAISLWREIYSGRPIDTTTWQTICQMEQSCESHIHLRSGDNESVLDKVQSLLPKAEMMRLNMNTQLWPIYEYLFYRSPALCKVTCVEAVHFPPRNVSRDSRIYPVYQVI